MSKRTLDERLTDAGDKLSGIKRLRVNFRLTGNNREEYAKQPRVMAVAQVVVVAVFVVLELTQIIGKGPDGSRLALLALWLVCGVFAVRGFLRVFGFIEAQPVPEEEAEQPDYSEFDPPPERPAPSRDIWAELGVTPDTVTLASRDIREGGGK